MVAQGNYMVVAVDEASGTLLGTGKVLIEHKLTHGCSSVRSRASSCCGDARSDGIPVHAWAARLDMWRTL